MTEQKPTEFMTHPMPKDTISQRNKDQRCRPNKAAKPLENRISNTILLVDDDEIILTLTSVMLSMLGFEVLRADNGNEAVKIFLQHQNQICLVLTDFAMPHMNGLQTLTALRRIAPNIPAIMVSGYCEETLISATNPDAPQAFLGKPFTIQALKDAIDCALAGKQR